MFTETKIFSSFLRPKRDTDWNGDVAQCPGSILPLYSFPDGFSLIVFFIDIYIY